MPRIPFAPRTCTYPIALVNTQPTRLFAFLPCDVHTNCLSRRPFPCKLSDKNVELGFYNVLTSTDAPNSKYPRKPLIHAAFMISIKFTKVTFSREPCNLQYHNPYNFRTYLPQPFPVLTTPHLIRMAFTHCTKTRLSRHFSSNFP